MAWKSYLPDVWTIRGDIPGSSNFDDYCVVTRLDYDIVWDMDAQTGSCVVTVHYVEQGNPLYDFVLRYCDGGDCLVTPTRSFIAMSGTVQDYVLSEAYAVAWAARGTTGGMDHNDEYDARVVGHYIHSGVIYHEAGDRVRMNGPYVDAINDIYVPTPQIPAGEMVWLNNNSFITQSDVYPPKIIALAGSSAGPLFVLDDTPMTTSQAQAAGLIVDGDYAYMFWLN